MVFVVEGGAEMTQTMGWKNLVVPWKSCSWDLKVQGTLGANAVFCSLPLQCSFFGSRSLHSQYGEEECLQRSNTLLMYTQYIWRVRIVLREGEKKKKWNRSKITAPVSVKTQINSCTAIHRWYIWYLLICLTMLQSFGLLHTYSVPTYAHGVCVYIVRDGKRERRGGGMERQKQRE